MTFGWADDIYYNEIQLELQKRETKSPIQTKHGPWNPVQSEIQLKPGDLGKWITNFFRQDNLPDLSFEKLLFSHSDLIQANLRRVSQVQIYES